ncbi:bifunctional RNase H/acid phosphatase [Streptomyces spiroverticillatus]|uniref:Bifunctional RNase H/acid phosphatase n=1 Tax=Streptomyces finlayi TaxID=67296 RepID=A0A918X2V1_9ACTN|nr:bifunctional RNase H/acid phosphatase [Streptomyces finlayi]GGZ94469.1 bifunctional RNase H/acid phosphatase [Streptomyces spiroverticillatus]GHD06866.1 bifunctional RNase H/acid phosphatase [Streptomyces finlayi]
MARTVVVEADGGSRGNPGPAGYGAVVLDPDTGETLAEAAEYIGVATNNVAEYKGLIAGLRAARGLFPDAQVHVRMDSKLVVEQMSGRWKIKHPDMKPLAAEAATVFPRAQVRYEWIPREKNKHADRLANEAMDAGKKGKQWEPSGSTAALDAPAAPRVVGDATAGAAKARAALAGARKPAADDGLFEMPSQASQEKTPSVGWGPSADLGAPATLVLLRHGETLLTPEKRFSGSGGSDPELSAVGRKQAEAVAASLAARGTIQAVVSSPLTRCRETADAVASRLGLPVRIEKDLRETDFGAWEGLTFAEVRQRYAEDLDDWLASPDAAPTGGGESFAAVAERVEAARERLVKEYAGKTVLVVTHVTPVKTLVRLALGAPPESLFKMELSAASLSAVAYYGDGNASVRLLNDTSHLR